MSVVMTIAERDANKKWPHVSELGYLADYTNTVVTRSFEVKFFAKSFHEVQSELGKEVEAVQVGSAIYLMPKRRADFRLKTLLLVCCCEPCADYIMSTFREQESFAEIISQIEDEFWNVTET